jgi:hypothetical protein
MPTFPVHAQGNQAEYPRETTYQRMAAAIIKMRKKLNFGVTLDTVPSCTNPIGEGICAGSIPYHVQHHGDMGAFRVFAGYQVQPILKPFQAFTGEAFWRMQPFYSAPHPSGLGDWEALMTPRGGTSGAG